MEDNTPKGNEPKYYDMIGLSGDGLTVQDIAKNLKGNEFVKLRPISEYTKPANVDDNTWQTIYDSYQDQANFINYNKNVAHQEKTYWDKKNEARGWAQYLPKSVLYPTNERDNFYTSAYEGHKPILSQDDMATFSGKYYTYNPVQEQLEPHDLTWTERFIKPILGDKLVIKHDDAGNPFVLKTSATDFLQGDNMLSIWGNQDLYNESWLAPVYKFFSGALFNSGQAFHQMSQISGMLTNKVLAPLMEMGLNIEGANDKTKQKILGNYGSKTMPESTRGIFNISGDHAEGTQQHFLSEGTKKGMLDALPAWDNYWVNFWEQLKYEASEDTEQKGWWGSGWSFTNNMAGMIGEMVPQMVAAFFTGGGSAVATVGAKQLVKEGVEQGIKAGVKKGAASWLYKEMLKAPSMAIGTMQAVNGVVRSAHQNGLSPDDAAIVGGLSIPMVYASESLLGSKYLEAVMGREFGAVATASVVKNFGKATTGSMNEKIVSEGMKKSIAEMGIDNVKAMLKTDKGTTMFMSRLSKNISTVIGNRFVKGSLYEGAQEATEETGYGMVEVLYDKWMADKDAVPGQGKYGTRIFSEEFGSRLLDNFAAGAIGGGFFSAMGVGKDQIADYKLKKKYGKNFKTLEQKAKDEYVDSAIFGNQFDILKENAIFGWHKGLSKDAFETLDKPVVIPDDKFESWGLKQGTELKTKGDLYHYIFAMNAETRKQVLENLPVELRNPEFTSKYVGAPEVIKGAFDIATGMADVATLIQEIERDPDISEDKKAKKIEELKQNFENKKSAMSYFTDDYVDAQGTKHDHSKAYYDLLTTNALAIANNKTRLKKTEADEIIADINNKSGDFQTFKAELQKQFDSKQKISGTIQDVMSKSSGFMKSLGDIESIAKEIDDTTIQMNRLPDGDKKLSSLAGKKNKLFKKISGQLSAIDTKVMAEVTASLGELNKIIGEQGLNKEGVETDNIVSLSNISGTIDNIKNSIRRDSEQSEEDYLASPDITALEKKGYQSLSEVSKNISQAVGDLINNNPHVQDILTVRSLGQKNSKFMTTEEQESLKYAKGRIEERSAAERPFNLEEMLIKLITLGDKLNDLEGKNYLKSFYEHLNKNDEAQKQLEDIRKDYKKIIEEYVLPITELVRNYKTKNIAPGTPEAAFLMRAKTFIGEIDNKLNALYGQNVSDDALLEQQIADISNEIDKNSKLLRSIEAISSIKSKNNVPDDIISLHPELQLTENEKDLHNAILSSFRNDLQNSREFHKVNSVTKYNREFQKKKADIIGQVLKFELANQMDNQDFFTYLMKNKALYDMYVRVPDLVKDLEQNKDVDKIDEYYNVMVNVQEAFFRYVKENGGSKKLEALNDNVTRKVNEFWLSYLQDNRTNQSYDVKATSQNVITPFSKYDNYINTIVDILRPLGVTNAQQLFFDDAIMIKYLDYIKSVGENDKVSGLDYGKLQQGLMVYMLNSMQSFINTMGTSSSLKYHDLISNKAEDEYLSYTQNMVMRHVYSVLDGDKAYYSGDYPLENKSMSVPMAQGFPHVDPNTQDIDARRWHKQPNNTNSDEIKFMNGILIPGPAGTGKSFLLSKIVRMIRKMATAKQNRILIIAPTNEMAEGIYAGSKNANETEKDKLIPDFMTLNELYEKGVSKQYDYIIIDEVARYREDKKLVFAEYVYANPNTKFIFTGDVFQATDPTSEEFKKKDEMSVVPQEWVPHTTPIDESFRTDIDQVHNYLNMLYRSFTPTISVSLKPITTYHDSSNSMGVRQYASPQIIIENWRKDSEESVLIFSSRSEAFEFYKNNPELSPASLRNIRFIYAIDKDGVEEELNDPKNAGQFKEFDNKTIQGEQKDNVYVAIEKPETMMELSIFYTAASRAKRFIAVPGNKSVEDATSIIDYADNNSSGKKTEAEQGDIMAERFNKMLLSIEDLNNTSKVIAKPKEKAEPKQETPETQQEETEAEEEKTEPVKVEKKVKEPKKNKGVKIIKGDEIVNISESVIDKNEDASEIEQPTAKVPGDNTALRFADGQATLGGFVIPYDAKFVGKTGDQILGTQEYKNLAAERYNKLKQHLLNPNENLKFVLKDADMMELDPETQTYKRNKKMKMLVLTDGLIDYAIYYQPVLKDENTIDDLTKENKGKIIKKYTKDDSPNFKALNEWNVHLASMWTDQSVKIRSIEYGRPNVRYEYTIEEDKKKYTTRFFSELMDEVSGKNLHVLIQDNSFKLLSKGNYEKALIKKDIINGFPHTFITIRDVVTNKTSIVDVTNRTVTNSDLKGYLTALSQVTKLSELNESQAFQFILQNAKRIRNFYGEKFFKDHFDIKSTSTATYVFIKSETKSPEEQLVEKIGHIKQIFQYISKDLDKQRALFVPFRVDQRGEKVIDTDINKFLTRSTSIEQPNIYVSFQDNIKQEPKSKGLSSVPFMNKREDTKIVYDLQAQKDYYERVFGKQSVAKERFSISSKNILSLVNADERVDELIANGEVVRDGDSYAYDGKKYTKEELQQQFYVNLDETYMGLVRGLSTYLQEIDGGIAKNATKHEAVHIAFNLLNKKERGYLLREAKAQMHADEGIDVNNISNYDAEEYIAELNEGRKKIINTKVKSANIVTRILNWLKNLFDAVRNYYYTPVTFLNDLNEGKFINRYNDLLAIQNNEVHGMGDRIPFTKEMLDASGYIPAVTTKKKGMLNTTELVRELGGTTILNHVRAQIARKMRSYSAYSTIKDINESPYQDLNITQSINAARTELNIQLEEMILLGERSGAKLFTKDGDRIVYHKIRDYENIIVPEGETEEKFKNTLLTYQAVHKTINNDRIMKSVLHTLNIKYDTNENSQREAFAGFNWSSTMEQYKYMDPDLKTLMTTIPYYTWRVSKDGVISINENDSMNYHYDFARMMDVNVLNNALLSVAKDTIEIMQNTPGKFMDIFFEVLLDKIALSTIKGEVVTDVTPNILLSFYNDFGRSYLEDRNHVGLHNILSVIQNKFDTAKIVSEIEKKRFYIIKNMITSFEAHYTNSISPNYIKIDTDIDWNGKKSFEIKNQTRSEIQEFKEDYLNGVRSIYAGGKPKEGYSRMLIGGNYNGKRNNIVANYNTDNIETFEIGTGRYNTNEKEYMFLPKNSPRLITFNGKNFEFVKENNSTLSIRDIRTAFHNINMNVPESVIKLILSGKRNTGTSNNIFLPNNQDRNRDRGKTALANLLGYMYLTLANNANANKPFTEDIKRYIGNISVDKDISEELSNINDELEGLNSDLAFGSMEPLEEVRSKQRIEYLVSLKKELEDTPQLLNFYKQITDLAEVHYLVNAGSRRQYFRSVNNEKHPKTVLSDFTSKMFRSGLKNAKGYINNEIRKAEDNNIELGNNPIIENGEVNVPIFHTNVEDVILRELTGKKGRLRIREKSDYNDQDYVNDAIDSFNNSIEKNSTLNRNTNKRYNIFYEPYGDRNKISTFSLITKLGVDNIVEYTKDGMTINDSFINDLMQKSIDYRLQQAKIVLAKYMAFEKDGVTPFFQQKHYSSKIANIEYDLDKIFDQFNIDGKPEAISAIIEDINDNIAGQMKKMKMTAEEFAIYMQTLGINEFMGFSAESDFVLRDIQVGNTIKSKVLVGKAVFNPEDNIFTLDNVSSWIKAKNFSGKNKVKNMSIVRNFMFMEQYKELCQYLKSIEHKMPKKVADAYGSWKNKYIKVRKTEKGAGSIEKQIAGKESYEWNKFYESFMYMTYLLNDSVSMLTTGDATSFKNPWDKMIRNSQAGAAMGVAFQTGEVNTLPRYMLETRIEDTKISYDLASFLTNKPCNEKEYNSTYFVNVVTAIFMSNSVGNGIIDPTKGVMKLVGTGIDMRTGRNNTRKLSVMSINHNVVKNFSWGKQVHDEQLASLGTFEKNGMELSFLDYFYQQMDNGRSFYEAAQDVAYEIMEVRRKSNMQIDPLSTFNSIIVTGEAIKNERGMLNYYAPDGTQLNMKHLKAPGTYSSLLKASFDMENYIVQQDPVNESKEVTMMSQSNDQINYIDKDIAREIHEANAEKSRLIIKDIASKLNGSKALKFARREASRNIEDWGRDTEMLHMIQSGLSNVNPVIAYELMKTGMSMFDRGVRMSRYGTKNVQFPGNEINIFKVYDTYTEGFFYVQNDDFYSKYDKNPRYKNLTKNGVQEGLNHYKIYGKIKNDSGEDVEVDLEEMLGKDRGDSMAYTREELLAMATRIEPAQIVVPAHVFEKFIEPRVSNIFKDLPKDYTLSDLFTIQIDGPAGGKVDVNVMSIFNKYEDPLDAFDELRNLLEDYINDKELLKEYEENVLNYFWSLNKMLNTFSGRIPGTAPSSYFIGKIVGIDHDGGRIYIPSKKNTLDNSDFDIDQLTTYLYDIINDNDMLYIEGDSDNAEMKILLIDNDNLTRLHKMYSDPKNLVKILSPVAVSPELKEKIKEEKAGKAYFANDIRTGAKVFYESHLGKELVSHFASSMSAVLRTLQMQKAEDFPALLYNDSDIQERLSVILQSITQTLQLSVDNAKHAGLEGLGINQETSSLVIALTVSAYNINNIAEMLNNPYVKSVIRKISNSRDPNSVQLNIAEEFSMAKENIEKNADEDVFAERMEKEKVAVEEKLAYFKSRKEQLTIVQDDESSFETAYNTLDVLDMLEQADIDAERYGIEPNEGYEKLKKEIKEEIKNSNFEQKKEKYLKKFFDRWIRYYSERLNDKNWQTYVDESWSKIDNSRKAINTIQEAIWLSAGIRNFSTVLSVKDSTEPGAWPMFQKLRNIEKALNVTLKGFLSGQDYDPKVSEMNLRYMEAKKLSAKSYVDVTQKQINNDITKVFPILSRYNLNLTGQPGVSSAILKQALKTNIPVKIFMGKGYLRKDLQGNNIYSGEHLGSLADMHEDVDNISNIENLKSKIVLVDGKYKAPVSEGIKNSDIVVNFYSEDSFEKKWAYKNKRVVDINIKDGFGKIAETLQRELDKAVEEYKSIVPNKEPTIFINTEFITTTNRIKKSQYEIHKELNDKAMEQLNVPALVRANPDIMQYVKIFDMKIDYLQNNFFVYSKPAMAMYERTFNMIGQNFAYNEKQFIHTTSGLQRASLLYALRKLSDEGLRLNIFDYTDSATNEVLQNIDPANIQHLEYFHLKFPDYIKALKQSNEAINNKLFQRLSVTSKGVIAFEDTDLTPELEEMYSNEFKELQRTNGNLAKNLAFYTLLHYGYEYSPGSLRKFMGDEYWKLIDKHMGSFSDKVMNDAEFQKNMLNIMPLNIIIEDNSFNPMLLHRKKKDETLQDLMSRGQEMYLRKRSLPGKKLNEVVRIVDNGKELTEEILGNVYPNYLKVMQYDESSAKKLYNESEIEKDERGNIKAFVPEIVHPTEPSQMDQLYKDGTITKTFYSGHSYIKGQPVYFLGLKGKIVEVMRESIKMQIDDNESLSSRADEDVYEFRQGVVQFMNMLSNKANEEFMLDRKNFNRLKLDEADVLTFNDNLFNKAQLVSVITPALLKVYKHAELDEFVEKNRQYIKSKLGPKTDLQIKTILMSALNSKDIMNVFDVIGFSSEAISVVNDTWKSLLKGLYKTALGKIEKGKMKELEEQGYLSQKIKLSSLISNIMAIGMVSETLHEDLVGIPDFRATRGVKKEQGIPTHILPDAFAEYLSLPATELATKEFSSSYIKGYGSIKEGMTKNIVDEQNNVLTTIYITGRKEVVDHGQTSYLFTFKFLQDVKSKALNDIVTVSEDQQSYIVNGVEYRRVTADIYKKEDYEGVDIDYSFIGTQLSLMSEYTITGEQPIGLHKELFAHGTMSQFFTSDDTKLIDHLNDQITKQMKYSKTPDIKYYAEVQVLDQQNKKGGKIDILAIINEGTTEEKAIIIDIKSSKHSYNDINAETKNKHLQQLQEYVRIVGSNNGFTKSMEVVGAFIMPIQYTRNDNSKPAHVIKTVKGGEKIIVKDQITNITFEDMVNKQNLC